MKNCIIRTLLILALAVFTLPILSQDYMNIYFKNGDHRKFYMKNITEIAASKVDKEGVQHSDYCSQRITTIYDTYVYNLEDVDSVTFTKIDEELVKQNFVSAMTTAFPIIDGCETIDEAETKIGQIKDAEGLEDVWSDGHQMYLKIAGGETYSFHFDHYANSNDGSFEEIRAMMPALARTVKNSSTHLKAVIANARDKDENTDYSDNFNILINNLGICGIDARYQPNPTVDFFYDNNPNKPDSLHFYDYDIVLLSTHGGYYKPEIKVGQEYKEGEQCHVIVTIDDILMIESKQAEKDEGRPDWESYYEKFNSWRNKTKFKDVSDMHINYNFVAEVRNNKWYWVAHPVLTEFFFKDIAVGKFSNPNSILYNTSCQSLKGDKEDEPSYSFANILFKERKLGVYAGYTESNSTGQRGGCQFFDNMAKGLSIKQSYEMLPEWIKYETKENIENDKNLWPNNPKKKEDLIKDAENAELIIFDKSGNMPIDFFFFPVFTAITNNEQADEEYSNHGTVTVEGFTSTNNIAEGFIAGFRYGLTPQSLFKEVIAKKERTEDKGSGNCDFMASIMGLVPGQTYYYQAYTYDDASQYNYGDIKSFSLSETQISNYHGYTSCPDNNHPHMIDLGLPSGTLWACCNVGSNKPEGYGNYYAWGETIEKSLYDWYTYQYGYYKDEDYSHLEDIGSDIGRTIFDVATENWELPWRMPSQEQLNELISNCNYENVTLNGVNGAKFSSNHNNGYIFLPAAGGRTGSSLIDANTLGYYWLSTINTSKPNLANSLVIRGQPNISNDRCYGRSIRPVVAQ